MTQAGAYEHISKTTFSVIRVLYSILIRLMWFFTLLYVRGISTVAAHIYARLCWSLQGFTKLESTWRDSINAD